MFENQSNTRSFDLKGQLAALTYPGGVNKVTRTYADAGRLGTVQDWLSHTTTISSMPTPTCMCRRRIVSRPVGRQYSVQFKRRAGRHGASLPESRAI